MTFRKICCLVLGVMLLLACSEKREYKEALQRIQFLVEVDADSALVLLDELGKHETEFGENFSMHYRLHRLNTLNKLDTVFHSTGEAKTLVKYFDQRGSANEQMLAYYLLGRAYHDTNESPMAVENYHTAAERADTTASDCNYRLLSRVYGQMAKIFAQQDLMQQSLNYDNKSIYYGWKGKDTLCALLSMGGKIATYNHLGERDSAILTCRKVSELLKKYGYPKYAAGYQASIVLDLIEKDELEEAKQCIEIYETQSDYFDEHGDIQPQRIVYYYIKGRYLLSVNKYDSAEHYFRKELLDGKDYNNQNAASYGLALLYKQINEPDSAAKYSLYSYIMNDSANRVKQSVDIERMNAIYDYSRNKRIAENERARANTLKDGLYLSAIILLMLGFGLAFLLFKEKAKRADAYLKYKINLDTLALAQLELFQLRSQETESKRMIENKEKQVEDLLEKVAKFKANEEERSKSDKKQILTAERKLQQSPEYNNLLSLATRGKVLNDTDWQWIYRICIEHLPDFWTLISSKMYELNEAELNTSILTRLHIRPTSICAMLNLSSGYITKVRISLLWKLFGINGSAKQFDEKVIEIA